MATIKKLNESLKNTNTEKIVDIIKNKLSKSSYLTYEEDETYSDNSARIRYHFNDNLINQANDKMKDVLNRTLIDITIKDYSEDAFVTDDTKDIEINIYSIFDMFRDDWCESLSLNNVNENEIIDYLEEKLGDEALLDNAQNNDTWEENLKEDLEVQNQHNKKKDIRKISKQDLIKATIDELNEPQDDLDFFVKQKLIKNVDDFKKVNKEELAKKMVNNKMPYVVMLDKDNDFAVDLSDIKNLKEDMNINQSSKGLKKKVVENKLQESRDFHNYKTKLEQAKTKDELTKIWNAFRKDYDSEMTPNEEKTLGELYKDLRKELTEDKQATYVWKKDGDDHILTEKGKDKALITLSRMNSGFPWTIYKGNKEITLDTDSDKLSDIKSYILKNVDKILGKKLKESNDDFVVDPLDDYLSDLEKLFKDKQIVNYSKLIDYVEQADIYDEDEIFLTTNEIDKTTQLTILNMLKQYFSEKNIPIAISVEDYNDGKRFIILVNANKYDDNFLRDFEYKGDWYNTKKEENLKEDKSVDDWLKPMLLSDTLERQPFISFAYEDQDGSTIATTSWETTPRKAHKDYIDTCTMKVIKDNYSFEKFFYKREPSLLM